MSVRDKQLLYHITAVDNLPGIIEHGLLSRTALAELDQGSDFIDLADQAIIEGRAAHDLHDYVPFHFFAKNPFDYAVVNRHPNRRFALLAVRRSIAMERNWLVIPRHPLSNADAPTILEWEEGLDAIDWAQMDRPDRDYEDHDCRVACMAEALSPDPVSLDDVFRIWVPSAATAGLAVPLFDDVWEDLVEINKAMFPPAAR